MATAISVITLLTDFGDRDYFVASMKGVILGINPQARIIEEGGASQALIAPVAGPPTDSRARQASAQTR